MLTHRMPKHIVVVQFVHNHYNTSKNDRQYDFYCDFRVSNGSIVVVDTQNGLQLAKVVGVKEHSNMVGKWVVDVVNTEAYQARMDAEKRQKTLEQQMQKRAKEIEQTELYRQLAQTDPKMKQMLEEYDQTKQVLFAWENPRLGQ